MKKFLFMPLVIICALCFMRADCDDSDTKQRDQQEKILAEGTAQLGMPAIKNFREKRILKMIIELRDQEKLIMYTYIVAEMSGQLVYIGKSMGYPIPAATQYTNPQKVQYQSFSIPQADPNGLFSPASAEGTWVMMIDPSTGDPKVVYIEPRVIVSPFPLR